jgi:hypothetical protein
LKRTRKGEAVKNGVRVVDECQWAVLDINTAESAEMEMIRGVVWAGASLVVVGTTTIAIYHVSRASSPVTL